MYVFTGPHHSLFHTSIVHIYWLYPVLARRVDARPDSAVRGLAWLGDSASGSHIADHSSASISFGRMAINSASKPGLRLRTARHLMARGVALRAVLSHEVRPPLPGLPRRVGDAPRRSLRQHPCGVSRHRGWIRSAWVHTRRCLLCLHLRDNVLHPVPLMPDVAQRVLGPLEWIVACLARCRATSARLTQSADGG
jgi:hypothetical protein